jgi:LytR cell envelope-related transcriptional attenuator
VEHVQPLARTFSWRLAALVASALALAILAGLVLSHQPAQPRPVAAARGGPRTQFAVPLRPRARLSVLVLNGNGTSGAAGDEATSILARGYRHAISTDAPSHDYARSLVLFRPGWQGEAQRLARDLKIPTVAALDGRVAPAYAHVRLVVILGAS